MIAIYQNIYNYDNNGVVYDYNDLWDITISPGCDYDILILDGSHGSTYEERKASIEQQAIEYSHMCYAVQSFFDLANVGDYFDHYGREYGLLQDFRENCIC